MAENVVASLSDRGWLRSPPEKADALMSHFYASQNRQSYIYQDSVFNIQGLIEQFGSDPHEISAHLQIMLERYFGGYFDRATVAVTSDEKTSFGTRLTLKVRCYLVQGDREFALEDLISSIDGSFKRIIAFNNDGTPILRNNP